MSGYDGQPAAAQSSGATREMLSIFCPRRFCALGVTEVTAAELAAAGFRAVLLDLDNTLVGWQRMDVSPEVRTWLGSLKDAGFRLCLISNTRFGRRLKKLSEELGIPCVRRAWKPRKKGFLQALDMLGVGASEAVMIGDQMFTDVWGANRLGIYTIMVKPMARREFIGTKVSRFFEAILLRRFRRIGRL